MIGRKSALRAFAIAANVALIGWWASRAPSKRVEPIERDTRETEAPPVRVHAIGADAGTTDDPCTGCTWFAELDSYFVPPVRIKEDGNEYGETLTSRNPAIENFPVQIDFTSGRVTVPLDEYAVWRNFPLWDATGGPIDGRWAAGDYQVDRTDANYLFKKSDGSFVLVLAGGREVHEIAADLSATWDPPLDGALAATGANYVLTLGDTGGVVVFQPDPAQPTVFREATHTGPAGDQSSNSYNAQGLLSSKSGIGGVAEWTTTFLTAACDADAGACTSQTVTNVHLPIVYPGSLQMAAGFSVDVAALPAPFEIDPMTQRKHPSPPAQFSGPPLFDHNEDNGENDSNTRGNETKMSWQRRISSLVDIELDLLEQLQVVKDGEESRLEFKWYENGYLREVSDTENDNIWTITPGEETTNGTRTAWWVRVEHGGPAADEYTETFDETWWVRYEVPASGSGRATRLTDVYYGNPDSDVDVPQNGSRLHIDYQFSVNDPAIEKTRRQIDININGDNVVAATGFNARNVVSGVQTPDGTQSFTLAGSSGSRTSVTGVSTTDSNGNVVETRQMTTPPTPGLQTREEWFQNGTMGKTGIRQEVTRSGGSTQVDILVPGTSGALNRLTDRFRLDARGKLVFHQGETGRTETFTRDGEGRILTASTTMPSVGGPVTTTETYAYGSNHLLSDYTDEMGNIFHFVYDSASRLRFVTKTYQGAGGLVEQVTIRETPQDIDGGVEAGGVSPAESSQGGFVREIVSTTSSAGAQFGDVQGRTSDLCGREVSIERGPSGAANPAPIRETQWGSTCLPYLAICDRDKEAAKKGYKIRNGFIDCSGLNAYQTTKYYWCDWLCQCVMACDCMAWNDFFDACLYWRDDWITYTGPNGGCPKDQVEQPPPCN